MEHLSFNYNVALETINCINDIDYTYHIIRTDFPILHCHEDYYEFSIILEGEIKNIRNNNKELITKNTLFISDTNDIHFFKKNSDNIKIINIIVREQEILDLVTKIYPQNFLDFLKINKIFSLNDDIIHIINRNINMINSTISNDWKIVNLLLKSTITVILNEIFFKSISINNEESKKNKKIIEKINDLKSNNKFFSLCVNDLCYELDCSRTHLNRIFYELFEMSPHKYLLKCKMEYAASLLQYTDYSVKEISVLVGYSSSLRFSHNFKEIYNLSPFEYRKK